MKTSLIALMLACMVAGCTNPDATIQRNGDVSSTTVREYEYEGCKYVRFGLGKSSWGAHAGDCPNPIHKPDSCKCK